MPDLAAALTSLGNTLSLLDREEETSAVRAEADAAADAFVQLTEHSNEANVRPSLEAAADFLGGLSLGCAPGDVGTGPGGQPRIRTSVMARMARFSDRSPLRLSRRRMVWPLLAWTG